MNNQTSFLNDADLDLVSGGEPNGALQPGLKNCDYGTPQGGGPGVYGQGTTCSGGFVTWFLGEMKAHGLPH